MRTFLLVDSSASMGYGRKGVTKLAYASYLAAALAYLLAQQGDPAGLMLFDEKTRQYLPPRTRGGHIRDLLVALEARLRGGAHRTGARAGRDRRDRGPAQPDRAVLRPAGRARRPGRSPAPGALARQRRRAVPRCSIPTRSSCRSTSVTDFEGMEPDDARRLLVDPRDLAASFARESAALRERWRQTCLEARVEYRFATTAEPPAEVLRAFLFARQRARR